ncbi:unnamed protein product [Ixodes hexagonus]
MLTFYAAELILKSLNTTVDPCNDFYAYACGNWQITHDIPNYTEQYGYLEILFQELENNIQGTRDGQYFKYKYLKCVFQILCVFCISVSEEDKLRDLQNIFRKRGFTTWPMLEKNDTPYKNYTEVLNNTSFLPLLQLLIEPDFRNVTSHIIYPTLIGRDQLIDQTNASAEIASAYKDLIAGTVKLFRGNVSYEQAKQVSEDIFQFEAQLAKFTKSEEDRTNFSAMYNKMNISELLQLYPEIDWQQLLNNEFAYANITLSMDEPVICQITSGNLQFTRSLFICRSSLYNFIFWKQIKTYGPVASKNFSELLLKYKMVSMGISTDRPLELNCAYKTADLLKYGVERLYAEEKFNSTALKKVNDLVYQLNSTFMEMLENNTWMDNATRDQAIKKLENMIAKIGYPSWILNDTYLNSLYEYAPDVSLNDSFIKVFYGVTLNNFIIYLLNLRQPDKRAEVSINMGGIGANIGHEISHAFSSIGNQFDAYGNMTDWWTNKSKEVFENLTQCFVEQYSNITVEEFNMTINGHRTADENIADYEGLKAAYLVRKQHTYRKSNDTDVVLAGLENITGDKLFFLSNALTWCQNIRQEKLLYDIEYDNHSPAKYRVNYPMGNLKSFSEAFGCNATSPMNFQKKCAIWSPKESCTIK